MATGYEQLKFSPLNQTNTVNLQGSVKNYLKSGKTFLLGINFYLNKILSAWRAVLTQAIYPLNHKTLFILTKNYKPLLNNSNGN
jgi:hypothetical protein